MPRPYVLLSVATSLDGYVDDASPRRLVLSDAADLDRVDEVRAGADAILVGAGTVRADDPRLLVRSGRRRDERVAAGHGPSPLRVTLTAGGADLDPSARVFTEGRDLAGSLVYAAGHAAQRVRERIGAVAEVVDAGEPSDLAAVLADLAGRGVARLMVEGGGAVHTAFLAAGLADELHLLVAPLLVGDASAPRFLRPAAFPDDPGHEIVLDGVRPIGNQALLRYAIGPPDRRLLAAACALAERCPPSTTAFSVGALIVAADGTVLGSGWSRRGDPTEHAEEAALAEVDPGDPRLAGATAYSSLEPCSARASRPVPCARLLLDAGIRRVVTAWREPPTFVDGQGAELLASAGVDVVEIDDLEPLARRPNRHLGSGG